MFAAWADPVSGYRVASGMGYNSAVHTSRLPDPVLITRMRQLKELVDSLTQEGVIAVDTESNSLYAYRERVCLIQFSIPGADYLVDPLALADLGLLAPVFADPGIEKVFHAAEYDLICLKRDFGFEFANIFDTMVAASLLGRRKVGLGSLLAAEFDVVLEKRYQRANWGQRPLPAHLLAYARLDTHYLIRLRDRLKAALKDQKRWAMAEEDFARACRVEAREFNAHSRDLWRINGAYDLDPRQAAVLQEMCLYRDRVAQEIDRPVFKVIPDRTLLAIAQGCPRTEAVLGQMPGMTPRQMRRHGAALLQGVKRGLAAKPVHPPNHPRPSEAYLARSDALRAWRKTTARALGVDSNVILPRDVLDGIARRGPRDLEALGEVMGELPWRLRRYGAEIVDLIARLDQSAGRNG